MPILGLKVPGPSHPPHFSLEPLIRPNILALQPYRCARDDYDAGILLDANENSMGSALPALADQILKKPKSVPSSPPAVATNALDVPGTASPSKAPNGDSAPEDQTQIDVAAQTLSLLSTEERQNLNRYPSPTHDDLKRTIARFRGVPDENWVFLGVGSDEVIDMLYRVLCVPGKDQVMTTPPTYGMYKVTANVNDVGVVEVPLITDEGVFQLDEPGVRPRALLLFHSS